jgi:hypothetical protein
VAAELPEEELRRYYEAFDGTVKPLYTAEKPNLREIGESMLRIIPMMLANYNPFPDTAYARKVGWPVNEDGTIETPGLGRVPSRELCEEKEIEKMYEVADLEELMQLEDKRNG